MKKHRWVCFVCIRCGLMKKLKQGGKSTDKNDWIYYRGSGTISIGKRPDCKRLTV